MTDISSPIPSVTDESDSALSRLVTFVGSRMLEWNFFTTPDVPARAPRLALIGQCILDTMTPEMEQALAAQGMHAEVLNWSGPGVTVEASLPYLDTFTEKIREHSIDAVLVFKGGNDILQGRPIAEIERDLDRFISRLKEQDVKIMLVGVESEDLPVLASIKNYPPEYMADAEKMFKDMAARHDLPLYPSFFRGLESDDYMNVANDWQDMLDPRSETYSFSWDGFKMVGKAAHDYVVGYEDLHPNAKGEEEIASRLTEWMKEQGALQPLTVAEVTPPPPAGALPPVPDRADGRRSTGPAHPPAR